jgi:hypothetical protein
MEYFRYLVDRLADQGRTSRSMEGEGASSSPRRSPPSRATASVASFRRPTGSDSGSSP